MPGARISQNGLRRIHDLQQTTESEGGEMTEWKIPQEMLEQNEEIKRLHAVISRINAERRTNAIDGQCAIDEANNRVAELEVELERWEQSRDGVLLQLEEIECRNMTLEAENAALKDGSEYTRLQDRIQRLVEANMALTRMKGKEGV